MKSNICVEKTIFAFTLHCYYMKHNLSFYSKVLINLLLLVSKNIFTVLCRSDKSFGSKI